MRRGKTRAQDLRVLERRQFVFALRKIGVSYDQIATEAQTRFGATLPRGYTRRSAWRDVMTVLEEMARELGEDVPLVRQLELARLDDIQRSMALEVRHGNVQVIDRVLKVMEHRARLLGLYSPVKVAPTTPAGDAPYQPDHGEAMITEEYVAEVAQHLAQYGLFHLNGNGVVTEPPMDLGPDAC